MNHQDFCYWLQGCFELTEPVLFTEEQTNIIERHLDLVEKVDGALRLLYVATRRARRRARTGPKHNRCYSHKTLESF